MVGFQQLLLFLTCFATQPFVPARLIQTLYPEIHLAPFTHTSADAVSLPFPLHLLNSYQFSKIFTIISYASERKGHLFCQCMYPWHLAQVHNNYN